MLQGGETLEVTIDLDTDVREVAVPADLERALRARPSVWKQWQALSYSHRREHVDAVEGAKKSETRQHRLAAIVQSLRAPTRGTSTVR